MHLVNNIKHEQSYDCTKVALFDTDDEPEPSKPHNKSLHLNGKPGIKFKKLNKLFNKHRRIESVMNVIDPHKIQYKKIFINRKRCLL